MDDIQNVPDIGNRPLQVSTSDGESVTADTMVAADVNVPCWSANHDAVVFVIDDVILH